MGTTTTKPKVTSSVNLVALMPIRYNGDDYAEGDALPAMRTKDTEPLMDGGWAELAAPDAPAA